MKILLVDDEREFVSALAERLHMRGYDADWASTGGDALEKAAGQAYDLAILDLKMPSIGGLELRSKLSALNPDTKFMFISGHGSVDDLHEGGKQETCYLIKPVSIEKLIEKIKIILPDAKQD